MTINWDFTRQNWLKFAFIVTCSIFLQSYWVLDIVSWWKKFVDSYSENSWKHVVSSIIVRLKMNLLLTNLETSLMIMSLKMPLQPRQKNCSAVQSKSCFWFRISEKATHIFRVEDNSKFLWPSRKTSTLLQHWDKGAFIYDVRCFCGIFDLPTYQILYYITLCSKIRCYLPTYLPTQKSDVICECPPREKTTAFKI